MIKLPCRLFKMVSESFDFFVLDGFISNSKSESESALSLEISFESSLFK
jgi:hypothetical protein